MNSIEFRDLLRQMHHYLEAPKHFAENPTRIKVVQEAYSVAQSLFADAKVELHDDPLQLGALILNVRMFDMNLSGTKQIEMFTRIISTADNFEIYSTEPNGICFAAVYHNAYIRLA